MFTENMAFATLAGACEFATQNPFNLEDGSE